MVIPCNSKDFHRFVNEQLFARNCKIIRITREFMLNRIEDIMDFVNSIRLEYRDQYDWQPEHREYFSRELIDKWKFSFAVVNESNTFYLINFSSVYDNIIHNHCTYILKSKRNLDLAKIHMLELCQTGIDNGFTKQEGYFPKNNNGSIALHLKMGWEIISLRNNKDLLMQADLETVRSRTYNLLVHQEKNSIELMRERQ